MVGFDGWYRLEVCLEVLQFLELVVLFWEESLNVKGCFVNEEVSDCKVFQKPPTVASLDRLIQAFHVRPSDVFRAFTDHLFLIDRLAFHQAVIDAITHSIPMRNKPREQLVDTALINNGLSQ